ncbi:hypothetical protein [Cellulomonas sp. SLBN-39]|uniref:hypothetical protein n=1 Tax=Cellulomonas sp. SLBN-39 TaxID=2768446 RepID=UPI00114EF7BD|nr:hypothetical protein [Cellulomonas sp. SLBN-39]TQL01862.1 hypothetical protein FBY24_0922 [Cellulomonas sp. SLBN-39]
MIFAPWTPAGFIELELRRRVARARATQDRGASAIEWVIITGILVAVAVAVGAVLYARITEEANSITIPDAPGGGGGGNE